MAEPVTIAGSAAAAAAPAVKKTLESLGKAVANQVGRLTRGVVDRAIVDIGIGFQDYLITSYNRCRCFKTIINPDRPLDTIKSYVHVSLSCGDETLKDDDLIWQLKERNCVVITGLAGSGKSMLMKYLTICKFENPQGILPLFVELRRLNGLRERNLITFIRTSCANTLSRRSEEQFNLALKAGLLMLILDGFDELNHEHRDEIQKQILELHKEFPNTIIVVSSRPDDSRFGSWSAFHVFKVNRLSKAQSIDLIKTLEYDRGVKNRFLKAVRNKLYESHTSFLSSPLLTTIMLLTYEAFAEIPDKMHVFYSQAFDTLFQKHDAQKEQYQRKTHTGLPKEEFKACFSAFSAMSYLDQKFSFDAASLEKTAEIALKYTLARNGGPARGITPKQFVDDLQESVCMLQPDGLETTFVHRSFQEYFAAAFVTGLHGSKIKKYWTVVLFGLETR